MRILFFLFFDLKILLYKHYTPEEYPTYDNYDAINVNTYTDIPCDYDGVMGVPVTFLDKFNPEQFEIIDIKGESYVRYKGNSGNNSS